jgi:hypothetical protein
MTPDTAVERAACLNCGAELHGHFCSACGQRVVPPYPTLTEMAGDAWEELSGYDGRFARTFRLLFRHPGRLTLEVLEGRRIRYISPVRLYLVASVLYFLVAAGAPNLRLPQASLPTAEGENLTIDLFDPQGGSGMTAEQRAQALAQLERAPWWARAIMEPVIADPVGFRTRLMVTLPRVYFVLVPVFAAIVALFERRRRFLQHLVFALHLHAAVFLALAVSRLSHFGGSRVLAAVFGVAAFLFIVSYALAAFRTVYRDRWVWLVPKVAGIALVYAVAGGIAMIVAVTWTAVAGGTG